jgi:hypothetical protein
MRKDNAHTVDVLTRLSHAMFRAWQRLIWKSYLCRPFRFGVYTNRICCLAQKAPVTISLLSQPVRHANPALLFCAVLLGKAVFNQDALRRAYLRSRSTTRFCSAR